jgi:hypothetical protein
MSVFYTIEMDECVAEAYKAVAGMCFLCGKAIHVVGIYWMGTTENIIFHTRCVVSFCRRTLQDWERVEFNDG